MPYPSILEDLLAEVRRVEPTVVYEVSEPYSPEGYWITDFSKEGKDILVLQYRDPGDFGLSKLDQSEGLNSGPQEVFATYEQATRRVLYLLEGGQ